MIIDLILDRRDGVPYDPALFAFSVYDYREAFPEAAGPILAALESKTEQIVKHALCGYVLENGYDPALCDYINGVTWTPAWWEYGD